MIFGYLELAVLLLALAVWRMARAMTCRYCKRISAFHLHSSPPVIKECGYVIASGALCGKPVGHRGGHKAFTGEKDPDHF